MYRCLYCNYYSIHVSDLLFLDKYTKIFPRTNILLESYTILIASFVLNFQASDILLHLKSLKLFIVAFESRN